MATREHSQSRNFCTIFRFATAFGVLAFERWCAKTQPDQGEGMWQTLSV